MYTGKIRFENSEIMSLYSIARFYKIESLEKDVQNQIEKICSKETILDLVDQCFDQELVSELKFLEQFIKNFIKEIDIKVLSDKLDVKTFAHSLCLAKDSFTSKELLDTISQFLGEGYEFENEDEQNALLELIDVKNKELVKLAKEQKPYWIPESFLNKLK